MQDQDLCKSLRERLLALPGRSVLAAALELGIEGNAAREAAALMNLATQRQRLAASARCVSKCVASTRNVVWKAVVTGPGRMLHFDSTVIGRLVANGTSREIVVYSGVDRCTGWAGSYVCDAITAANAARALLSFKDHPHLIQSGGVVVVDTRWDVRGRSFDRAVAQLSLHKRSMVGYQAWSNATVEMHHRMLRHGGFGSVPMDRCKNWSDVVEFVAWFDRQFNTHRSAIFTETTLRSPAEVAEGLAALSHLPWRRRLIQCRLIKEADLQSAQPARISTDDRAVFIPTAQHVDLDGPCPEALLVRRTPSRIGHFRGRVKGQERWRRHRQNGVYLYV